MFERIIEIIIYVISELRQETKIQDINLLKLQEMGYSQSEISAAFSWLADRVEMSAQMPNFMKPTDEKPSQDSFRILHLAERELFSKEAWGEILEMEQIGLLNSTHIEEIIERCAMAGYKVTDVTEVRNMAAQLLFHAQMIKPAGSRFMLSGSDTVN
ncbi:MAG TPA: DUF494 family protein [Patescibacteria group bacterium]|nr:DUF494 family protein [Patescibacteria group bacterium]